MCRKAYLQQVWRCVCGLAARGTPSCSSPDQVPRGCSHMLRCSGRGPGQVAKQLESKGDIMKLLCLWMSSSSHTQPSGGEWNCPEFQNTSSTQIIDWLLTNASTGRPPGRPAKKENWAEMFVAAHCRDDSSSPGQLTACTLRNTNQNHSHFRVLSKMSNFQIQITRHAKKKEKCSPY